MRPDRNIECVYLHRAPVDMRKQIDGLATLAKEIMRHDPMSGAGTVREQHAQIPIVPFADAPEECSLGVSPNQEARWRASLE